MSEDRDIERLLRQYGKKRQDEGTPSGPMHPAMRQLLQGEVRRVYGQEARPRQAFGWFRLWPRLVFALGLFLLMVFGMREMFDLDPSSQEHARVGKEAATEQTLKPEEAPAISTRDKEAPVTDDATRPIYRSIAPTNAIDLGTRSDQQVPGPAPRPARESLARGPEDRLLRQRSPEPANKQPSEADLKKEVFTRSEPVERSRRVLAPDQKLKADKAMVQAQDGTRPQTGVAGDTSNATFFSAQSKSLNLALEQNTELPPGGALKDTYTVRLSDSAVAPATSMPVDPVDFGDTQKRAARYVNDASATPPAISNIPATRLESVDRLARKYFFQNTFSNVSNESNLAATRDVDRAKLEIANSQSVLNSFEFTQTGDQIQITDSDGSIYTGKVVPAVEVEAKFKEALVQDGKDLSPERALGLSRERASSTALEPEVAFATTGTNRTLNQVVVFSGTVTRSGTTPPAAPQPIYQRLNEPAATRKTQPALPSAPSATSAQAPAAPSSAAALQTQPGIAGQAAPRFRNEPLPTNPVELRSSGAKTNIQIRGRVQIGQGSTRPIQAVPTEPR